MGDCTYSGDSWSLRFPCLRRTQSGGSRAYLWFARGGYPHPPFRRSLLAMSICLIYRQHRNVNPVVPVPFFRFLGLPRVAPGSLGSTVFVPSIHRMPLRFVVKHRRKNLVSHCLVRFHLYTAASSLSSPASVHFQRTHHCTTITLDFTYLVDRRRRTLLRPKRAAVLSATLLSPLMLPSSPRHPSYAQHIHDMRSLGASCVGSCRQADGGVDGQSGDDRLGAAGWRRARGGTVVWIVRL
ncbi:hypothetical protein BD309DRAFT_971692 [Dichomitus squalens]|uniref:Uncharacterized protein n=1 Tax=Dichomitus squalens TaxID=114155 RepID=A0A4Q9NE40_9APHY|nr:hypothetical protein BD309DRAFT_971692 [Dichomitus squalens]TBU57532.1 hypothetical protein BD310DRAFT_549575 [Dichomitus squalens]